jgi:hypothetical protein
MVITYGLFFDRIELNLQRILGDYDDKAAAWQHGNRSNPNGIDGLDDITRQRETRDRLQWNSGIVASVSDNPRARPEWSQRQQVLAAKLKPSLVKIYVHVHDKDSKKTWIDQNT